MCALRHNFVLLNRSMDNTPLITPTLLTSFRKRCTTQCTMKMFFLYINLGTLNFQSAKTLSLRHTKLSCLNNGLVIQKLQLVYNFVVHLECFETRSQTKLLD